MKSIEDNSIENKIDQSGESDKLLHLNFDDLTLKDAKQIFKELQEHQIELQKQNEELRKKHHDFDVAREKYINLINNSPTGFATLNEKVRITDINVTAAKLLGQDPDILKDQLFANYILGEDKGIFELNFKLVFDTEEPQEFDIRLLRKNNEIFWCQIKLVIIKAPEGSRSCNVIINSKNEHKRTEKALKESILQWNKIFNGISDSICLIDADGKLLKANKNTTELLDKRESDLIGLPCTKIIHGSTESADNCPFQKAKITKKRETLIIEFQNRWMEIIVDPLLDEHSNFIGAVHIMSDITDRQRVEESLKESEEKFKSVFEDALDGILITDIENKEIISGNKMICKMLGYDSNEISGVGLDTIFCDPTVSHSLNLIEKDTSSEIRKLISIEVIRTNSTTFFADINSSFVKIKGKKFLLSIIRDITQRMEIEKELKETKERFELIFNSSPDAILITRIHDGHYIDSNETFTKYTGFTRDELNGKSTLDVNIWNNPSDRNKLMAAIKEKGFCRNLELVVRNKNGTFRTIIMSAEIIPLHGTPHLLSISRDITDRKEMEKLFRQSEEKYRLIADNAIDVILVFQVKSRKFTYVSPSIKHLTGYNLKDVKQMDLKELLTPESFKCLLIDLAKRMVNFKNDQNTNRSKIYEIEVVCKDGSKIWTELSTTFNVNEQGEIEEIIGVNRNIHERKIIQEKEKQNELRLASLLKITQGVFESDEKLLEFSLQEAIKLTASKIGYFYLYNEQKKEFTILAWSKDTMEEYNITEPQNTYKLENSGFWGEVVHQRKAVIDNNFTKSSPLKKGYSEEHIPLNKFLSIPVIIDNKIEAVVGVTNKIDDYTETDIANLSILMDGVWKLLQKKDLEKLLQEKNEELQNLIATKDRFFSIIAHDLKNPFNIIIGFSELIMNNKNNNGLDNLKKYASYIHTSSKQAYNLLVNLLEWSSSQRGLMQFNPEAFEIEPFINETIHVLQSNTEDKKIKITINIPAVLQVYADKNMLGIILRNLISNAIKYTHVNGIIDINVVESEHDITFSVTDNGTGIKEEDLEKLFKNDIQFTTPGTNSEKGTGLGLLLCHDFVLKHKGRIWAESEYGKGSTFFVTLPKLKTETPSPRKRSAGEDKKDAAE